MDVIDETTVFGYQVTGSTGFLSPKEGKQGRQLVPVSCHGAPSRPQLGKGKLIDFIGAGEIKVQGGHDG